MERSPDHFEVVEGRGFFRPVGVMSLEAAAELLADAIAHARTHGIKELLVNATGITGPEPPSLSERYFIVANWARVAGGAVRLALVLRPEYIDPQKFGVTVAINRRLIVDVFELEAVAIPPLMYARWYRGARSKRRNRPKRPC
jgi:hypothetical protein